MSVTLSSETTAAMLAFVFYLLSQNPEVEKKVNIVLMKL